MFPVIKLQQLHTEPLGFSQCKVVQAELPNPSAILQNHSTAEHSPVNTLSSLERAIQHWPWLPAKLLIQQLSYGTRQSSSPRQEVALSHLHFFLLFHWGIHSEGKNQIIQQPMNQHSMAQQEHWSCNFNCQELHVGLELPLWTPTKGHCQLILSVLRVSKVWGISRDWSWIPAFFILKTKTQASDTDFFQVQVQEQPSIPFFCTQ